MSSWVLVLCSYFTVKSLRFSAKVPPNTVCVTLKWTLENWAVLLGSDLEACAHWSSGPLVPCGLHCGGAGWVLPLGGSDSGLPKQEGRVLGARGTLSLPGLGILLPLQMLGSVHCMYVSAWSPCPCHPGLVPLHWQ